MSSSNISQEIIIDLKMGDQLTTISCGHIVVELIKFIAYQRLQIPYTYQWLKQVVNKKKLCEKEDVKESFQSERHFRAASTALENLDLILKSLLQEINGPSMPEEVCLALGATPVTCKEVYRMFLPTECHKPQCHSNNIATDQKIQRNVFRNFVTSEKLSQVFFKSLPPTNMYVFIKKKLKGTQEAILSSENFLFFNGCMIPKNSKIVVIDFRTNDYSNVSCCNEFQVFGDIVTKDVGIPNSDSVETSKLNEIESSDTSTWYQSSYVMKGFKDCVVNGSSITNTWLNS